MISHEAMLWVIFGAVILILFALDLGIFHKKSHEVGIKEALTWSGIWLIVAIAFNLLVYFWMGTEQAIEFAAGYLVERTLSFDNLFVFLLIFSYFKVPEHSSVQNPLLGHHRRPGYARRIHNCRH